ncbi:hypothetical protein [Actinomadura rudentiformis]|uniref:hypothetical protein n=1 Tax=Actinomadura rudentiformis TaxID=359158 RepID=UPI00178C369E|nr:hypothetical protein [Actinomadura rudentiformis]
MQLPRVVIAAVFFVIGALIAIPAIIKTTGDSNASTTPAGSTTSPTPTGTSPSPTATMRTNTATPTRTASPTPTRTTPSPTPTRTTSAPPERPLKATIGTPSCPSRKVTITVRNTGSQAEDYAVERDDGSASIPGRIAAGATRESTITLREDRSTRIEVTHDNESVLVRTRKANCRAAAPPENLPVTGADDTVLWARAVTGGAAMITGIIIFWYGGIWPRRRAELFEKK